MKRLVFLSVGTAAFIMVMIALASSEAPPSQPQPQTRDPHWEILAPGIEYREYHLADPNNVYVARMEISRTNVTLESGIGSGYLATGTGLETVRGIASRYDDALSQWSVSNGWGSARSNVVVAINGDYFYWDKEEPYELPHGGMIQGGAYIRRFEDTGGRSGFGWKFSRTPFIGECVVHPAEKQFVQFADGSTQSIDGINVARDSDQLILYTSQYDTNTRTDNDNSSLEVVIELDQPAIIYPAPKFFSGTIREKRSSQGAMTMLFDYAVLSAQGNAASLLESHVAIGDKIQISQEIWSRQEFNCDAPLGTVDWSKTYASVGGGYYFLKDGLPKTYNCSGESGTQGFCNRVPRTAIAYNDQYIYFIVVDGRDLIDSIGMSIPELTIFARDTLSATYGISQDGGGSSTMVINGEVVNNTFCNNLLPGCVSKIYLPIAVRVGTAAAPAKNKFSASPTPTPSRPKVDLYNDALPAAANERGVANGMMMVVVEPEERSELLWADGQPVIVTSAVNLRMGPGTNYASQGVIPADVSGTIQPHSLNGIFAKGYYWWKVRLDSGQEGWIVEEALATP